MNIAYAVDTRVVYPLKAGQTVAKGEPLSVDTTTNTVQKMPAGTGLTFVGIALDTYTNAPSGTSIQVIRRGVITVPFTGSFPSNWLGALLYWNGSQYTFSSAGNTAVGRVIAVAGNNARIVIQPVV
jgi:predicted RecA/RadA family phage recombinase